MKHQVSQSKGAETTSEEVKTRLTLSEVSSASDFYLRRPSMVTSSGSSFAAAARTSWNAVQNMSTTSSGIVLSKVASAIESGPPGVEHTCEGSHY